MTEEEKREVVLAMSREVVLVRIYGDDQLPGFRRVSPRDTADYALQRLDEARELGVDAAAYDDRIPHTGLLLHDRVRDVSVAGLVEALEAGGLVYVGGNFTVDDRGRKINTLTFERGGEKVALPDKVSRGLANLRFREGSVWCNRRYQMEGGRKRFFRLDSINLVGAANQGTSRIELSGNTWSIA